MIMGKYKSREYCRDIMCSVQANIETGKFKKKFLKKRICKKCEARRFHKWLKAHNYAIVDKHDLRVVEKNFEEVETAIFNELGHEGIYDLGLDEPFEYIQNVLKGWN